MAINDSIRGDLIKQFPADVIETEDAQRGAYYICPTCKRTVARSSKDCQNCGQKLSWEKIRREEAIKGNKVASLSFEVPHNFKPGDCRRCPLSIIGKHDDENVYTCPINMRHGCRLKVEE